MAEIIFLAQLGAQNTGDGACRRSKPAGGKAAIEPRQGILSHLDLQGFGSIENDRGA
ncbi:hypothetical protein [Sinorhizobium fredii]|uniref:hypothetical protein n=1 Tax=Rhizobium fredii TaxID=380 RepID=UPI0035129E80